MSQMHQPIYPKYAPWLWVLRYSQWSKRGSHIFLYHSLIHSTSVNYANWVGHEDGRQWGGTRDHKLPALLKFAVWTKHCSVGAFTEHCHFKISPVAEALPTGVASCYFPGLLRRRHLPSPGPCLCHQFAFLLPPYKTRGQLLHAWCSLKTSPKACKTGFWFCHSCTSFYYGPTPGLNVGGPSGTRCTAALKLLTLNGEKSLRPLLVNLNMPL